MKFKKSISFVLTLCMVLSLFATFVIPVAADEGIELLVSHHNLYNWGTFEGMVITGDGQTVADVIPTYGANIKWWNMYVIENVDGEYVATEHYKNVDECHTTPVPAGGFLYYVYSDNSDWAKVDDGVLLGYTFELVDFTLEESFAIDTNVDPSAAKHMVATAPAAAPELPEGAVEIEYLGYIHAAHSMVAYAEADMTLGALVNKYLGQVKDLNYCKVAVCDGDGTVVAVYLTLGREPAEGPNGIKTDLTIAAGQFAVIYNANKAGHEVMDAINVGDTITLYNVDALESHTGTAVALENAGFTVEAAPEVTYPEGYTVVSGENGKWQSTEGDFEFAYNWVIDGETLVVDVIVTDDLVSVAETTTSANGIGTNVRLWINYGAEKWDALYDGFILNDVVSIYSKTSAGVVGTEGTIALADNTFTFTLPLAEVSGGNEEFQFTICVSNTDADGNNNACLYAPCDTFAWSAWDSANAHTVTWEVPEAPVSGISVPEDIQLFEAPYAGVDVLVDGETAEGKFGCFDGNQAYLVAVMNNNAEANVWDVTIALDEETTFNTVTVYYWDEANSCIHMPTSTTVTVNGKTYTVENTTESVVGEDGKVHAVVIDLGEDVTASSYTVSSTMAADQTYFFNMMTEIAVSYVEVPALPFEDGDNVVITYPADNLAISAEEDVYNNKYRLAGTDVANGAVFTVDITDDGIYFICNGKYLTSGATGNNLTLEDEASEYSLWVLEEAENGWYIKNVNAAYNGSAQYIEYYYAFTTYGFNASKADIYTFQFDVQEAPALNEVDGGELPAHNPRVNGALSVPANTAVTYTVAFENGANFNLWDENVTVLVNGEALEMGMLGYVAILAKGDTLTIVNAGAEAIDTYPSISAVILGTYSNPIVLDELGDITANLTADNLDGAVHYVYTATANGTLTITMPEDAWTYVVHNITAGTYGDTQWCDSEDSSATTSLEVSEGDQIMIIVAPYDVENQMNVPGELTFNAAFEANVVVSQVVENFNHADWNTGINTFHAAYIFTDAEIYAGVGMEWWYHVSFAPTANGGYVVVEVAAPGSEGAKNNSLVIPEGGFVWVAWTSSEEGYGASSGAYAKAIMSGLKAGDIVLFNGLDIANCTTTADASATVLAPAADMDLLVSHNYNYSWHCFETQIISGLVPDAPKTAGDAPNMAGYVQDADILYIVENVGGAYLVTGVVGGKDAILATEIPEGGFLYYVTSNCTGYDAICHGELIGKYLLLGDIDLATTFAIDTSKDTAYTMKAVSGFGKGDVNLNGEIDATDYAILRKLVLGTITAEDLGDVAYGVADVNGDGKVNARDYYLVKRAFLGTYVIPGWEVEEDEAE